MGLALVLTGCVSPARVTRLEAELHTLRSQLETTQADYELRLQSATVAIDKNRARVDEIVPPDAQWMRLGEGESLRWYLGEGIDSVYVQFLRAEGALGQVEVGLSCRDEVSTHVLQPGESAERLLTVPPPPRRLILSLHQLRRGADGVTYGLFSVVLPDEGG